MEDRPPSKAAVGFNAHQQSVVRAVEEQSILDQVSDFTNRMNRLASRLEAFVDDGAAPGEQR